MELPPSTTIEEAVCGIWHQLVEEDSIGGDTDGGADATTSTLILWTQAPKRTLGIQAPKRTPGIYVKICLHKESPGQSKQDAAVTSGYQP
jgi:hypothetical protein